METRIKLFSKLATQLLFDLPVLLVVFLSNPDISMYDE